MIGDLDARRQALEAQNSYIVQAPAGSGKTGLLVYRMLTLLAKVEQPQQVLAITFTRKATAEMRERLLELLEYAESGHNSNDAFEQQGIDLATLVLQQDRQCQWRLLDAPQQLQILTIDSFCAKLTSSMPWLSRLGDKPRTTDQAETHYLAAIESLFAELLDDNSTIAPALNSVLLELDFNYNKARTLFASMLAKRDQWLRHFLQSNLSELRSHLEQAWYELVAEQIHAIKQLFSDPALAELCMLAQYADANLHADGKLSELSAFREYDQEQSFDANALQPEHWRALCHFLLTDGKFRKKVNIKQGFVARTTETNRMHEILAEFQGDEVLLDALNETKMLPETRFNDSDWEQLLALEKVLKVLAGFLQLRFRATGECDHSEVTQRANLALHDLARPTDLGLRLDAHLQHILVDEFQDTSHGQIELLKKLTEGWYEYNELNIAHPKTLFLVGDPMQSIYRFREADVSLFLQVKDNAKTKIFPDVNIQSLSLTENFRSCKSLVNWFNDTFSKSFPKHNNVLSGAINYASATCSKEGESIACDYFMALTKEQEAEMLLEAVKSAIETLPNNESQVAILVKTRSQLEYLLPVLKKHGISFSGIDIQPLAELQAVIDTLALCKAICREDDRVSWLALLRGPWCGLTLAEIHALTKRTEFTIWQQINCLDEDQIFSCLMKSSALRLMRFKEIMRQALQQQQQTSLANISRWAWLSLGGEHTLGDADIEDIETIFSLIQKHERGGDLASMSELDKGLKSLYAQATSASNDGAPNVVVSTMHKSKGLQYHTVILPGLSNHPRSDDKEVLMWAEAQNDAGDSRLLIAPYTEQSESSMHYQYLRHLEKQRSNNESIRLMYVATTRAEQKLVLIARGEPGKTDETIKAPRKDSLLSTVWDALESRFSVPFDTCDEKPASEALPQTLNRLNDDYKTHFDASIEWQIDQQLNAAPEVPDETEIEYEWATPAATAIGIILHDWLQYHHAEVLTVDVNEDLVQRWRAELLSLRVQYSQLDYAIQRLQDSVRNIQAFTQGHFIFKNYPEQENEFSISAYENGLVKPYRIDRTFVDENGVRWIIDYKSTPHDRGDVARFAKEQVAQRHRPQLEKYGALLQQLDSRPIKLAVYFPLLKQLIAWPYSANND